MRIFSKHMHTSSTELFYFTFYFSFTFLFLYLGKPKYFEEKGNKILKNLEIHEQTLFYV